MLIHLAAMLADANNVANPYKATSLASDTWTNLGLPLLEAMQVLIPAVIAIMGLHKLLEGKENAGMFFVEMLAKGGTAVIIIQLMKTFAIVKTP